MFMGTGMLGGWQRLQALTGGGQRQAGALLRAMGLPGGRGFGYGTMPRLVSAVHGEAFEAVLFGWARAVWEGQVGRGSRQGTLPGVHRLSVGAQELGITLTPAAVPPTPHEATAC